MSRYIDADALLAKYGKKHFYGEITTMEYYNLKIPLDYAPTADVVEVVHGEWIPIDVGDCCYRCSVCNFVRDAYLLEEDNYCPHCGARMDLQ